MNIRPYRDGDLSVIEEVYSLSKLDELGLEKNKFELLPLKEDAKRLGELMESQIYVYEDAGIIAYGAVFKNEIRALFVHPSFRGSGVGSRLLAFLIAQAEAIPTLYVAKHNLSAKALYEKHGFTVTEEFETHYNGQPVLANKMIRRAI